MSGLAANLLQAGEESLWEDFVAAQPSRTIYHTLAWKRVTEEGLGHRAFYLRTRRESGDVTGVLPLFLVKGVFGRRLVSVPMRDRGGVLAVDAAATSALVKRAVELSAELKCQYLELRSLENIAEPVRREHHLVCQQQWITTRVDLTPGVDALWKQLDRDSVRWAIGKAGRQGVVVETDVSPQGLNTFFELFVRTRRRLGIPPFPRKFFDAIWRNILSEGKGTLVIVRRGPDVINAMISFLSGESFVPAYAAPQLQFSKLYPSETIFWHSIRWAAENGYRFFDFGADSPRQEGLLFFKKKMGGVQQVMSYNFHLNRIAHPPDFDSSSPRYDLVRKVWMRLPTVVAKPLGNWVTRQLS